jgi:hypothetical protein
LNNQDSGFLEEMFNFKNIFSFQMISHNVLMPLYACLFFFSKIYSTAQLVFPTPGLPYNKTVLLVFCDNFSLISLK